MYTLTKYQPVALQPDYQVLVSGEYNLLDLVPCGLYGQGDEPNCAFLVATCVGINL
jgi:hypothetical protein